MQKGATGLDIKKDPMNRRQPGHSQSAQSILRRAEYRHLINLTVATTLNQDGILSKWHQTKTTAKISAQYPCKLWAFWTILHLMIFTVNAGSSVSFMQLERKGVGIKRNMTSSWIFYFQKGIHAVYELDQCGDRQLLQRLQKRDVSDDVINTYRGHEEKNRPHFTTLNAQNAGEMMRTWCNTSYRHQVDLAISHFTLKGKNQKYLFFSS